MGKLTSLSESEWERVAEVRETALSQCLTDGISRDDFAAAAATCYATIDQPAPAVVVAPGPIAALVWSAILADRLDSQLDSQLAGQLYGQLYDRLADQLHSQLAGQLHDQLHSQLHSQLYSQLDSQLHSQLADQLSGQLADQLHGQLADQLSGQLHDQLDSQLGGQLYDRLHGQLHSQLGGQLADQLHDQLDSQLHSQLADRLHGQLAGQLHGQLGGQLHDRLYDQLYDRLHDQLCGQLCDQLHDQLDSQLYSQLGGVHWSGWRHGWATHWLHVATLDGITAPPADLTARIEAYRDFTVPPMTFPLTGVVIGVGPHVELHRDHDNRLHSTTGPAWSWPDGTAIYALDGIRVPDWVVTAPDARRIISDELSNTEQRRVALAHLGWDRAVVDLELSPLDDSGDPHIGTLYELPESVTGDEGLATLLVARNASPDRDGSWRTYGLLAAPNCRTAVEAQASLAGLRVDEWLALDGAS